MSILYFIFVGVIAGYLAGVIYKGGGFGLAGNLIVGIVGAVLGGFAFGLIGLKSTSLLGEIVTAVVGSILLLAIINFVKKKS